MLKCKLCEKDFKTMRCLKKHDKTHSTKMQTECLICGLKFNPVNFASHQKVHVNLKPHQCEICEKSFNKKVNLKRHHEKIHSSEKSFKCMKCDKIYLRHKYFENHMKKHEI